MHVPTANADELELLRRVDAACGRFEQCWKRGERPRLEDELETAAAGDRPALLVQMLLLEWSYRRDRGEAFTLAEYQARFAGQAGTVEQGWEEWLGGTTAAVSDADAASTAEHDPNPTLRPRGGGLPPCLADRPDGYRDLVLLGEGGMGVVYRGFDPRLQRLVALKMLKTLSPARLQRFSVEAKALARLSHPHIVQVFSWDEMDGRPCLVMEYVSSGSLEERLRRAVPPPVETARLVAILARAVQAAHGAGVVHRDLKPANVLLAPPVEGNAGTILGGFPKISDFGLARLAEDDQGQTATGVVLGTPHYMAPEQALGRTDEIGTPADVWALGVILYRCLVGQLPFAGDSMLHTLELVRTAEPAAPRQRVPGVPVQLEALCLRCLDKKPGNRPTAGELAAELERYAAQAAAEPAGWAPVAVKPAPDGTTRTLSLPAPVKRPRQRVLRAVAVSALLAVLAAGGLGAWQMFGTASVRPDDLDEPGPSVGADGGKRPIGPGPGKLVRAGIAGVPELLPRPRQDEPAPQDEAQAAFWRLLDEVAGDRKFRRGEQSGELKVQLLGVLHFAIEDGDVAQFKGMIGDESKEAHYKDAVKIGVELTRPGYAYLLAFNSDGSEQLLWPVNNDKKPDPTVKPPEAMQFVYPARAGRWFYLNDKRSGGLQAFAVVLSSRPLPPYEQWKKQRGPAAWKELGPGKTVWEANPTEAGPVIRGVGVRRGDEGDLPGEAAMLALCRSLRKAGVEQVKAMAFPVQPRLDP